MLPTSSLQPLILFVVIISAISINEAQQRWGPPNPFGSNIRFEDESSAGSDIPAGWNDVSSGPWRPRFPMQQQQQRQRQQQQQQQQRQQQQQQQQQRQQQPQQQQQRQQQTQQQQQSQSNRQNDTSPFASSSTSRPTTSTQRTTTASPEQTQCINRCPTSTEYNPVCGSNSMTYNNPGRLRCAASCGTDVEITYYGVCRTNQNLAFPRRDP